jgi:hypothetical protein
MALTNIISLDCRSLTEQYPYSVLQDIFSMKRDDSSKIQLGQEKIRKSKALGRSEDEVADLACYGVGQSPK